MYRRKRDVNASSTHFYARPERAWKQTALVRLSQHALGAFIYISAFFLSLPRYFPPQTKAKKKQIREENLLSKSALERHLLTVCWTKPSA